MYLQTMYEWKKYGKFLDYYQKFKLKRIQVEVKKIFVNSVKNEDY